MVMEWGEPDRRTEPRTEMMTSVRLSDGGVCMGEGFTKNYGPKSLYVVLRCADHRLQKDGSVMVEIGDLHGKRSKKMKVPLKGTIVRMEATQGASGVAVVFPHEITIH